MSHKDVGRQFAEVNHLIHREIQKNPICTDDNDQSPVISHSSSCIIAYLHDHQKENIYQRDLEQEFKVRRSTMSKTLTLLEQKGYIERVDVCSDKRLKRIVLKDKAKLVIDDLNHIRKTLEEKMTQGISPQELNAFRITLDKIKHNLNKEDNV